jgi:hypothetical protein
MFSFLNRRRGVARSPIRLFRLCWGEIRLTLVFLTNGRFAPEAANRDRHLGEITENFVATIRRSLFGASGP